MRQLMKVTLFCVLSAPTLASSAAHSQQPKVTSPQPVVVVTPPPTIRTIKAGPIPTQFSLSPDGKTIIVSGNIETGAAAKFQTILDAVSTVQTVALISGGGKLDEATLIYKLIKDRALNTYVDQICMSACTMIFLGGSIRSATPQAKMGFHQPYYITGPSRPNDALVASMRRFYDEANVRPSFTDQAMRTPSREMWYPSFDELLAANVVTVRVTGGQTSTLFSLFKAPIDFENALLTEKTFRLLKFKHPEIFKQVVEAAWTAKQQGLNDNDISTAIRATYASNLKNILMSADDAVFLRYLKLSLEQTKAARNIGYDECFLLTQGQLNIQQNLPEKLWREELAILTAALESTSAAFVPSEKEIESSMLKLFKNMTETELSAIVAPLKSSRIDVCNSLIKMYEDIERMPLPEQVLVARYLLASE